MMDILYVNTSMLEENSELQTEMIIGAGGLCVSGRSIAPEHSHVHLVSNVLTEGLVTDHFQSGMPKF